MDKWMEGVDGMEGRMKRKGGWMVGKQVGGWTDGWMEGKDDG